MGEFEWHKERLGSCQLPQNILTGLALSQLSLNYIFNSDSRHAMGETAQATGGSRVGWVGHRCR